MSKRVLVCDPLPPSAVEAMRVGGLAVDERFGLGPDGIGSCLGEYDAVVVRETTDIREAQLKGADRLRVIVRAGVGFDNVDVTVAEREGIRIFNTPAASALSVAEMALAMIFSLSRHLSRADRSMKDGEWGRASFPLGTEVEGRTLGILGVGRVGRIVAAKGMALGMPCVGADPALGVGGMWQGLALVSDEHLFETSDVVSIHVGRTSAPRAAVGAAQFTRMRKGALLVNCSRGGVVDEAALLDAIESGIVGGAALDVYATEPPADPRLVSHPRVLATPHIGAWTVEAQRRIGLEVAEILLAQL